MKNSKASIDAMELLSQCGEDAQSHQIETDRTGTVRFKADKATELILRMINLNELWRAIDFSDRESRLSIRKFYRNMGYSLSGYIEVFGDQLDAEENGGL